MPRAKVDLINRVASILGWSAFGQTLPAEESASIESALPGVNARLRRRNAGWIANFDAIDDAIMDPFAYLVAETLADEAGLIGEQRERVERKAFEAEFIIRSLAPPSDTNDGVGAEYF